MICSKKTFFRLFCVVCFLALLWPHWGCDSCDECGPHEPRLAIIGYWDFPAGESYTLTHPVPAYSEDGSDFDPNVDFIARVYYPSADASAFDDMDNPNFEGIEVLEGPFPLVVFGHGQCGWESDNYLGTTHLLYHLVSWGYICVSINLDILQGGYSSYDSFIPHRGEIFLHAIQRMNTLNGDSGSLFYGRVDMGNIALIGHSRGGGGAISAVNQNQDLTSPWSLKALATISPVDFGTDPVQDAVPHICLYGSWDGDLKRGDGPRIWDGGVRTAHKEFVEIYGANHFHFTDNTVYSNELNGITRDQHQQLAQGFINAYFDVHVQNNDRWDWPLYLSGHERIYQSVEQYIQILTSEFLTIDDGSPVGSAGVNNMTGSNTADTLTYFNDALLEDEEDDHFYGWDGQSEGLLAHWDNTGDLLNFEFPSQDASQYDFLHFRTSQRPVETLDPPHDGYNLEDTFKNWKVRLEDGSGGSATVIIKDYLGGLQYPDFSDTLPHLIAILESSYPGYDFSYYNDYNRKSIPRSYRIPLEDFSGVNLTQVTKVVFLFDAANEPGFQNTTGAIAVDDLEFTR